MSKRKLLLADDSVTIQKVVNLTFADEGIEVITVGDGDSAIQKISETSPDVVLADVHMPGLSGYQICEILRENAATKNLPVVLLVGSFEPFDESEAARVGANAYLTKPFQSIRQLVTQVTELLDASVPAEPAQEAAADQPDVKVPDTSDIDSLYRQSVEGEIQQVEPESEEAESEEEEHDPETLIDTDPDIEIEPETERAASRYVDAGMDDEMIETVHAAEYMGESSHEHVDSRYVNTDAEFEPAVEQQAYAQVGGPSAFDTLAESEYSAPHVPEVSSFEPAAAGTEVSSFEPADGESETTAAAAPESETATAVAPAMESTEVDHFSQTERMPDNVWQQAETPVAPAATDSFALDDTDLLDLPPIEPANTVEFTIAQSVAEQTGNKQVVSLSPELMDVIVQKVVEKLSNKE